jgi:hypothetical protein
VTARRRLPAGGERLAVALLAVGALASGALAQASPLPFRVRISVRAVGADAPLR